MKKCIVMLFVIFFLVLVFCGIVVAKEYILNIYMVPQERLSWCGVSVVQAWLGHKLGICFSVGQQDDLVDSLSSKIRTKAELNQGWNAGDVEKALEELTGSSFSYHDHYTYSSAFNRIKEELKDQRRPLAISANACYPNGVPKTAQNHWMLIEALKLRDDNGAFDGVYVKDPLYGSRYASNYEVLRPRTWVRDLFVKWWIPNKKVSSEFRQSVED